MKVLIVEDDENKRNRVARFLKDIREDAEYLFASSLVEGLRMARDTSPDLVILDMTLPNYSEEKVGGRNPMRAFGGREFLRQSKRLGMNCLVAVLTQFETFGSPPNIVDLEQLDAELRQEFSGRYLGAIYYHASQTLWQKHLARVLAHAGGLEA